MTSDHYILDGHTAVQCDLMTWAKWLEKSGRDAGRVDKTQIGDVLVSTVFLGSDHSFDSVRPMLFETMVFGGALDQEMERCTTWEEAQAQHKAMVEQVKAVMP